MINKLLIPKSNLENQRGALLIIGIVVMSVLFMLSTAVWSSTMVELKASRMAVSRSQLLHIAEAGLDKAVYELNQSTSFSGESNIALGAGTYTTTVATIDSTNKQLTSTAYIPNATNPTAQITVKMKVGIDTSVISFRYGVQAGSGGFVMNGGSTINGSVYSNGNIAATNGVHITGSATAANPPALTADQTNATPTPISSCTSSTCVNFGDVSNATEDFAQSFQISNDVPLASIDLYLKKTGAPANPTVKIVNDNSGSPGSTVYLSGTLNAGSVTGSFGWANVTMNTTTPVLEAGTTYWLVIDHGYSNGKYYTIGANSNGYASGQAKVGRQSTGAWSNTTPSGLDGYFKINLGGGYSMIGGNTYNTGVYIGTATGDEAYGHTVQGATVISAMYCQTSSYTSIGSCNTSRSDPPQASMPLSDSNITDWKDDALTGGTQTGDVTIGWAGGTLGPKKIVGNLTVNGGGILTVTGTLWVTGNVTITAGGQVKLDASYGSNSGAIVNDGYVTINGGANFAGSGTAGSYPFLITTSACPVEATCGGNDAVNLSGGAGTVAVVAQDGNVTINGGSNLKAVTGKQITMAGGATLTYDSGLISENFNSGPGGSWAPVAGTYLILE